jgi:hypothetical protein
MPKYRLMTHLLLWAFWLATVPAFAAQQTEQKPGIHAELKGKVFQLSHRAPHILLPVLQPLTSGSPGALITGSEETLTISVRDFPENLEAIEAAIRLLDKPETVSRRVGLEIQISLIGASQEASAEESKMPSALVPVIAQLQRTLSYKHYRYITTLTQRTLDQGRVGASGTIAGFFPGKSLREKSATYEYNLRDMRVIQSAAAEVTIQIGDFEFVAGIPVVANPRQVEIGIQPPLMEIQRISMATGLTLREGEQVVVGTSNAGEEGKAVIVVISIRRASN